MGRVGSERKRSGAEWGIPPSSASLGRNLGCRLGVYARFEGRGHRQPRPIHGLVAAEHLVPAPSGVGSPGHRRRRRHPAGPTRDPRRAGRALPADADDERNGSAHPVSLVRQAIVGTGHLQGSRDLPPAMLQETRPGHPDPPGRGGAGADRRAPVRRAPVSAAIAFRTPNAAGDTPGRTPLKNTALIRRRILARRACVGVVGQGYVGLTLACIAAEAGFPVPGIDTDAARVAQLAEGRLVVPGVLPDVFRAGVASERLAFTTETGGLAESDIIAIFVPTPLRNEMPDLSFVESACREVTQHLTPSTVVILESTTYPGTTDDLVMPILETSGLRSGRDFLLAYSPERIDPGNQEFPPRLIPKIVGGSTPEATGVATLFYNQIMDKVVTVSSCRAAELAKLLENTFRHVNIALVNEMAVLCHEMGIDVWEVIDAAATKPFGFMTFYPGPGVGGNCIPVDPAYLAWQVRRDVGHQFRILEQAQDINAQMPGWVAARISEALNEHTKPLKGARVLVLGVAYKPDVGDIRESPSLRVMSVLERRGVDLAFHDPFVDTVTVNGKPLERTELTAEAVAGADLVAVLTPHSEYDLDWLARIATLVFDARNAYGPEQRPNLVRL